MTVLLGVTGGIAAYKSVEILRALQERGAEVEVVMTRSAQRFLTPLTFSALTGRPVHTSLWTPATPQSPEAPIEHITLAQTINVLLIAPATAHTLARFAHGSASDLLSTVYLATKAPVVIAPAMNVNMWHHPATQANVHVLRTRGACIIEPAAGYLACGMTGSGRLAATDEVVTATMGILGTANDLVGQTVLVTAGGTREAIDPVRYIGNRSSGRMGHALAAAAQARGAKVVLITASALAASPEINRVQVESADQMWEAIASHLESATIVCAAAAVADFRPVAPSASKLRRQGPITLDLQPTPDLVARIVDQRKPETLVVAFAAEMQDVEQNARAKLHRKGADAIVANDVADGDIGFESEMNAGLFLSAEVRVSIPKMPKRAMADLILNETIRIRRRAAQHSLHYPRMPVPPVLST